MTRETVTVVLTDLHSNALALRRALEIARTGPIDRMVILGDLFTYGADESAVFDMVEEAQRVHSATLLIGNHDQLYFDLAEGRKDYFNGLPPWLRECAELTSRRIDVARMRSELHWQDELVVDSMLFSHANPFGHGNWTYLNADREHADAARALQQRGLLVGCFGHTHRRKQYVFDTVAGVGNFAEIPLELIENEMPNRIDIVNPGSIGQPRSNPPQSSFLRIHQAGDRTRYEFVPVDYDVDEHIRSVRALPLSEATKDVLCRFFVAQK